MEASEYDPLAKVSSRTQKISHCACRLLLARCLLQSSLATLTLPPTRPHAPQRGPASSRAEGMGFMFSCFRCCGTAADEFQEPAATAERHVRWGAGWEALLAFAVAWLVKCRCT